MAAPLIVFGGVDAYGARRSPDEVRIIREMLDEDIARFVTDSGIDGPAARDLKSEAPEIQWAVLQRGPVRSASNPSAALVGRIRDAKQNIGRLTSAQLLPAAQQPAPAAAAAAVDPGVQALGEVDRFILDNRLDPSAGANLKAEAPEVQRLVMQKGPLLSCYNPNGALMGRIKAARSGQLAYRPASFSSTSAGGPAGGGSAGASGGAGCAGGRGAGQAAAATAAAVASSSNSTSITPVLPAQPSLGAPPTLGGVNENRLSQDAMKAIQQLNAGAGTSGIGNAALNSGGGAGGGMLALANDQAAAAPPPAAPTGAGTKCSGIEDSRLNEEAMKAVQMLNAGGP